MGLREVWVFFYDLKHSLEKVEGSLVAAYQELPHPSSYPIGDQVLLVFKQLYSRDVVALEVTLLDLELGEVTQDLLVLRVEGVGLLVCTECLIIVVKSAVDNAEDVPAGEVAESLHEGGPG